MDQDATKDLTPMIEESINGFKEGLRRHSSPLAVVREFITHGSCLVIDTPSHAALREIVAAELGIHPNRDVYTVGSAKLGFSIKPSRRYGHFDDDSDIDVAIVSPELYLQLWSETRKFISSKEIWSKKKAAQFKEQHIFGRISPKNLPKASPVIPTATRLWELGKSLQRERVAGPYSVTFAVWAGMDVLEDYQAQTVLECQKLETL